ncbi:hypothetical protein G9O61_00g015750 [Vairimorpha ceranae]|nr:hypothetical protein G9O61_00g015750 [Vairimorpha ceranae]
MIFCIKIIFCSLNSDNLSMNSNSLQSCESNVDTTKNNVSKAFNAAENIFSNNEHHLKTFTTIPKAENNENFLSDNVLSEIIDSLMLDLDASRFVFVNENKLDVEPLENNDNESDGLVSDLDEQIIHQVKNNTTFKDVQSISDYDVKQTFKYYKNLRSNDNIYDTINNIDSSKLLQNVSADNCAKILSFIAFDLFAVEQTDNQQEKILLKQLRKMEKAKFFGDPEHKAFQNFRKFKYYSRKSYKSFVENEIPNFKNLVEKTNILQEKKDLIISSLNHLRDFLVCLNKLDFLKQLINVCNTLKKYTKGNELFKHTKIIYLVITENQDSLHYLKIFDKINNSIVKAVSRCKNVYPSLKDLKNYISEKITEDE